MPLELTKETRDRLVKSVKRFAVEELELEVSDLKADVILDFVLKEIGPSVYNQAVADAQKHLGARVEEMSGSVHRPEFAYWRRRT